MRILRLIQTLNPAIGGPIESVRQSSAALQERGHEIDVLILDREDSPWLQDIPFPVHALGTGRPGYGYAPRVKPWLQQHARSFDAVLVHGLWQYPGFVTWRVLRHSDPPYFVFPHGMLDPWFARRYPLKHIKKKLYWPLESRVLRGAQAVLFTSEEEKRQAEKSFFAGMENARVVAYGTAAPRIDFPAARERFLASFPALRNKRLILFLGRLHDKKGCDLLLKGFATAYRNRLGAEGFHLVIAGPGPAAYLNSLQALAQTLFSGGPGPMPVTLPGMLSGDLKWGAFAASEAFTLPSHQENFGIAVAEALACGTPVLISKQVNIWREITEDAAGFADADSAAGVERLLNQWAGLSATEREEMQQRARNCFAQRFEIGQATDSLISVLSENAARA